MTKISTWSKASFVKMNNRRRWIISSLSKIKQSTILVTRKGKNTDVTNSGIDGYGSTGVKTHGKRRDIL